MSETDPCVCTCQRSPTHVTMSKTNIPAYVLSVQRVSNSGQKVKFNHYKKTGSSGVKGRVRSYSIYIENLKLVGSVQRGLNPDQNVKFNHYKKTGSSGVKGRVRSRPSVCSLLRPRPTHSPPGFSSSLARLPEGHSPEMSATP